MYQRWMELARERGVVQGREMRIDSAVVETNIHYPTDSGLLGDGARVLTRTMKKVEKAAGGLKKRIRNRMHSVNKKVIAIALAGRWKGPKGGRRASQTSSGTWLKCRKPRTRSSRTMRCLPNVPRIPT